MGGDDPIILRIGRRHFVWIATALIFLTTAGQASEAALEARWAAAWNWLFISVAVFVLAWLQEKIKVSLGE